MSITVMREDEVNQLVKGLLKHSEPYRQRQLKTPTKPIAERNIQRDRELMECFRNR
ncbi:hypothetical protein ACLKL6_000766 [Proteus mirabilis]|nr:hypothetical protein [Proteus mirabilis]